MKKRDFLRTLGLGMVITPLAGVTDVTAGVAGLHGSWPAKPIYPPLLKKGDTIGIVCPSSAIAEDLSYLLAEETFEAMGFRVKWGKHAHSRYGHLAGRDDEKLADLHGMFADSEVKAIVCMRGGSGAARLLDQLDYELIRKNPKIFIGYSDITALLNAIYTKTGLITFHGPMGISTWSSFVVNQFETLFLEGKSPLYENPTDKGDNLVSYQNRTQTITPGIAEGYLIGGNLSVLTGVAGSPYYPDFKNSILFIEEVGEQLYRVERMFSQLRLTGALSEINGFVFGQCTDCEPADGYGSLTLDEILDEYIKPLAIPAYKGALIGHISEQFILPVGAAMRIDADSGTMKITGNIFS